MEKNTLLARKALQLGFDCYQRADFVNAEILFQKVLKIEPKSFDAHHFLGVIRLRGEQFSSALPFLENAVMLKPEDGDANHHLGLACKGLNDLEKAFFYFTRALKSKPNLAPAHLGVADVLSEAGKFESAIKAYRNAIKCDPKLVKAHNNLGTVYRRKGSLSAAIDSYRTAISISPDRLDIHSNLLMCMATAEHVAPEEYLKEACSFAEHSRARVSQYRTWPKLSKEENKQLRVGFVSGDLRRHPAAEFIKSFIPYLDNTEISLIAFSTSALEDDVSASLKNAFQEWYVIERLPDQTVAKLVYDKEIDILIDMSGHTSGNRLPIFSWKAAPIQISWVGYFASTGMSEIDYLLPNSSLSPPEYNYHYAEKPWIINPSACLAMPDELPDVKCLPVLTKGFITFGSFHSLAKISDSVLRVWCNILLEVPDSKVFFKCRELVDQRFREQLLDRCKRFGISEDRVLLEGATPMTEYLQAFNSIDIGLDPFPYNSGTVGFHSLLMGVPYVSLRGDRMLSRIGFSNLAQVGLGSLAAQNLEEYQRRAIDLAMDIQRLENIRNSLRNKALESGLFDGNKMAITLQTAFREMWALFLKKQK